MSHKKNRELKCPMLQVALNPAVKSFVNKLCPDIFSYFSQV